MSRLKTIVDTAVLKYSEGIRRIEPEAPNPRPVAGLPWYEALVAAGPEITAEWERFCAARTKLPLTDELLGGDQGAQGDWRAGVLATLGKPSPAMAEHLPTTTAAVLGVPGLRAAMLSVLAPGASHPPHMGCNAGALKFLWGVDCPEGSGLDIEGTEVELTTGMGVLFDDTVIHSSWNRGDRPRAIIMMDVRKPLTGLPHVANGAVLRAEYWARPEYRTAKSRSIKLHESLNRGQA